MRATSPKCVTVPGRRPASCATRRAHRFEVTAAEAVDARSRASECGTRPAVRGIFDAQARRDGRAAVARADPRRHDLPADRDHQCAGGTEIGRESRRQPLQRAEMDRSLVLLGRPYDERHMIAIQVVPEPLARGRRVEAIAVDEGADRLDAQRGGAADPAFALVGVALDQIAVRACTYSNVQVAPSSMPRASAAGSVTWLRRPLTQISKNVAWPMW
jgi:hypothetical protein